MFISNIHIPVRLVIMIQSYPRVHKSWMPGITHVTKFCRVVHNTSGYSVWNLLHILLISRISRWLLHFWKICATLVIPTANLVHLNHIYILWISCPCNIINTVHTISAQHSSTLRPLMPAAQLEYQYFLIFIILLKILLKILASGLYHQTVPCLQFVTPLSFLQDM